MHLIIIYAPGPVLCMIHDNRMILNRFIKRVSKINKDCFTVILSCSGAKPNSTQYPGNHSLPVRRCRLQGACGEIENGAETDGDDGADETDDVVGHTEIRSREGDKERF